MPIKTARSIRRKTSLGSAAASAGWQISVPASEVGPGPQRLFAEAVDVQGTASPVVSAVRDVGVAGYVVDGGPGYSESGSGWQNGPLGAGFAGSERIHAPGSGEDAACWSYTGLMQADYRVAVTWQARLHAGYRRVFRHL